MGLSRNFCSLNLSTVLCVLNLVFSAAQRMSIIKENQDGQGLSPGSSYFFYQHPEYPHDCYEVLYQCSDTNSSAVYFIKPVGYHNAFEVYCDNDVDGGGWTVFQRRTKHAFDFNRPWSEYENGFGFLSSDFWLGFERLSFLTNQKNYEIRIDIENSADELFYVQYNFFRISDQWSDYKLSDLGEYGGNGANVQIMYSMPLLDCSRPIHNGDLRVYHSFLMTCPANMEFGNCNCQPTCEDPDGSECYFNCSENESCVCQSGFLKKEQNCVPPNECGCFIQGAGILESGQSHVNLSCTSYCECLADTIVCKNDYRCSSDATCGERDGVRQCYCNDGYTGDGQNCEVVATDCADIYNTGVTDSGVYTIKPANWSGPPFEVYCNITDEAGWTVFQRRVNGSENFYLGWNSYKRGFGSPNHELWLGNDKIYYLTNQKNYQMRIDLVNRNGVPFFANYDLFRINDEEDNYRLIELGSYTGNTGNNAMFWAKNKLFSTYDRDNDGWDDYNCAKRHVGAWWYGHYTLYTSISDCQTNGNFCEAWPDDNGCGHCSQSNLNGDYDGTVRGSNIHWSAHSGNDECRYAYTEMKIKPVNV